MARKEVEQFRGRHPSRPVISIITTRALAALKGDPALEEQTKESPRYEDKIWLDESDQAVESPSHGVLLSFLQSRIPKWNNYRLPAYR